MPNNLMLVSTTVDTAESAQLLASWVIESRLGACAHISGPITSVYRWDGAINTEKEWRIDVKTTKQRVSDVVSFIQVRHSYDVPEITVKTMETTPEYLNWLTAETRPA